MVQTEFKRSGIKAVTWRIVATLTTMSIVYVFTGKVDLMMEVGIFDVLLKLVLYFVHERVWDRVSLGRSVKEEMKYDLVFNSLRDMENILA